MGTDPNKYSRPDYVKDMFDRAVDTVSAPSTMVHNPGVAVTGLVIGAAKNFTDMAAIPLSVAQQAGNYLTGKGPVKPEDDIFKKYEEAAQNLAIEPWGIKDKLTPTQLQDARKAAASAEFLGSFLGMHGFAGKTPLTKGGLAGAAGEVLTKANIAKSNVIGGVAKILPDQIFTGASKVRVKGAQGELTADIASIINPKTATNIVAAKAPEAMVALSEKYSTPIAKIKDIGEPLYEKLTSLEESSKKSIDIPSFIKEELNSIDGLKGIDPEARAVLEAELHNTLREKLGEYGDVKKAEDYLNHSLKSSEAITSLNKQLESLSPIENPTEAAKIRDLINDHNESFDSRKLIQAGKKIRGSYEKEYLDTLLEPNIRVEDALANFNAKTTKLIENIGNISPEAAKQMSEASTQSIVGRIGQLGNLFKAEPIFGDFTQINEALPIALIKNAEKLGLNPLEVVKHKSTFSKWYQQEGVRESLHKTVIEPNRSQFDAIYQQISVGEKKITAKNVSEQIFDEAAKLGMSNQIQFRERMIESVILPEAYAQVKASGILAEGTKEFNSAVISHTKSLIEEAGMIPPEASTITYKDAITGKNKARTGTYDSMMIRFSEENKGRGFIGKNATASSNFMLKWVKGAAQAKLKSWNVLNETLDVVNRTGKVTDVQKSLITNSVVDLVAGTILFGGRGMRIPGLINEVPSGDMAGDKAEDNGATLITGAIASMLKLNPELAKELKDGYFYKLTGLSSARTNNIPLTAIGAGNEILESIVKKRFGKLLSNLFGNMSGRDNFKNYIKSGQFTQDLIGIVVSADTDIIGDVNSKGQRYDSKGKAIDIDLEKHPLGHTPGVDITKNVESKDNELKGINILDAPKNIVAKHKRLNDKDFLTKDNIKSLQTELESIYKGDKKRASKIIKSLFRDRILPDSGESFGELATLASSYNSMIGNKADLQGLKETTPILKNMTKEEAINNIALSGVTQGGSHSVANLLITMEAGGFNPKNPEDIKLLKNKVKEMSVKMKSLVKIYKESKKVRRMENNGKWTK